jgi:hypothetical protein
MIDGASPIMLPTAIHMLVVAHETEYKRVDEVVVVATLQVFPSQCVINGRLGLDLEVPTLTHIVVVTQETESS